MGVEGSRMFLVAYKRFAIILSELGECNCMRLRKFFFLHAVLFGKFVYG